MRGIINILHIGGERLFSRARYTLIEYPFVRWQIKKTLPLIETIDEP